MATESPKPTHMGQYVIALAVVALCLSVSACETPTSLIEAALVLVEDRTRAAAKTDTTINLKVNAAFLDQKNGLYRDIAVDVYESDVLLTGTVKTDEDKRMASALVDGIPGTRKVFNEVHIAAGNGIRETAADITIETKIKSALRQAEGVHSFNMRWRSVSGTVYLFGRALSKSEQETSIAAIEGIDGVERLINVQKIAPVSD
jgi:osmotically-inducible protein OsmY